MSISFISAHKDGVQLTKPINRKWREEAAINSVRFVGNFEDTSKISCRHNKVIFKSFCLYMTVNKILNWPNQLNGNNERVINFIRFVGKYYWKSFIRYQIMKTSSFMVILWWWREYPSRKLFSVHLLRLSLLKSSRISS